VIFRVHALANPLWVIAKISGAAPASRTAGKYQVECYAACEARAYVGGFDSATKTGEAL
jgi:hypothetical protein